MSAQISTASGQAELFLANTPAWHGLGTMVNGTKTWSEAIKLAHLNWTVDKRQLLAPDHRPVEAWGIFRHDTDAFLGAVGSKYTPIQNEKIFETLDALVEAQGGAHYETAGALGQGERIWALVKIPDEIRIKGTDDVTKCFLLGSNRHDGTGAMVYKLTTIRVVCNNTLTRALSIDQKTELRIRHTASANDRMEAAKKILIDVKGEVKSLQAKLNYLKENKLKVETLQNVLKRLFPKIEETEHARNLARDVLYRFERADGGAFPSERGTALNLFNAVTEWVDHGTTRRGTKEELARKESALFGSGDEFKQQALDYILEATGYDVPQRAEKVNPAIDNILAKMA